jgi:NAD(P)H-hydrate epimerase
VALAGGVLLAIAPLSSVTGVIPALLAQGLSPWDAACTGVALHARAGDLAAGDAPRGLVASDLFAPLRELVNGPVA